MAYVAPAITASAQTFAQLQKLGSTGYVQGLVTAQAAETTAQVTLVNQLLHKIEATLPATRLKNLIDDYLRGDPIAVATMDAQLLDLSFAFKAVATAIDEMAALVDANPGTLTFTGTTTGIGMAKQIRTFP